MRSEDTETFLKRILTGCATYVAAFDDAGVLLCVSESWKDFGQQNGYTSDSAYGLYDLETCRQTSGGPIVKEMSLRDSLQRIRNGRQTHVQEEFVCKSLSSPHWFMTKVTRIQTDGCWILVTLEDVTRRRRAEEEFSNLGGRLINGQEEERTRLARELHDDLSQRLGLLAFEIDQLRSQIPEYLGELKTTISRLLQSAQEVSGDVHRLSHRLHPFKLDHFGLSASVESLCKELSLQNLRISFQQFGVPAKLPGEVTLCVFRIAQESLHNVLKHSEAKEAKVVLTNTPNGIDLQVSDDGKGFDIEQAARKKRLGLISMKERLRLVNGKISISSKPGYGTQIDVSIPLC